MNDHFRILKQMYLALVYKVWPFRLEGEIFS